MDYLEIVDENELKLIVNSMNKVNQVMKKVNNLEDYVVIHDSKGLHAETYASKQLPRRVLCSYLYDSLNSKQKLIFDKYENLLSYSVDCASGLFEWIRDYKKGLSKIVITEDSFILYSGMITYTLGRKPNEYFQKDTLKIEDNVCDFDLQDLARKEEVYSRKGIFNLYIDLENQTIEIDKEPDSESFLKIVISHKYLTGFSGMKPDNSSINFKVNFTEIDGLFLVVITVRNKSLITENHFCVVDS